MSARIPFLTSLISLSTTMNGTGLSEWAVFGEPSADFDDMLRSPKPTDAFWQTHNGGADARGATDNAKFPILFATGFYDIYTGGIFDMWNKMSEESRSISALVVSPYNHGDGCDDKNSIVFKNGKRRRR